MVHVGYKAQVAKLLGIVLFCSQLTLVVPSAASAALVDVTGTNASGDLVMRSAELVLPQALFTGRTPFHIADSRVHLPVGEPVLVANPAHKIGPVLAGLLFLSSTTVSLPAAPSSRPVFELPVFRQSYTPPPDRGTGTILVGPSAFRSEVRISSAVGVFGGNLTGTVGTSFFGKFKLSGTIGDPTSIPNTPIPDTFWLFVTGMIGLILLKYSRWFACL